MKHLPTSAVVSWDSVSGSVCAKLEYILLSVSVFAVPQRTSLSTHFTDCKTLSFSAVSSKTSNRSFLCHSIS